MPQARPAANQALIDEPIDPAIVRRASEWMARLWSGEAGEEEKAACERWRAAHPDHERAWSRLQIFEEKLFSVPRDVTRHALCESAPQAYVTRRRTLQLLGMSIVLGNIAYTVRGTDSWQIAASDHSTRIGEIREITLPDGTRIVLATATAIDVRFTERERLVALRAGEILVTTSPDPATTHRPFIVQSRQGRIQALGTRFTVRQDDHVSQVAVFEGAVEIRPSRLQGIVQRIDAGQRTAFSAEELQSPSTAQLSSASWTRGLLVAENMRVADFIDELGRYRPGLLRCDPDVSDLQVSGVFSLRDTDRALHNLALALPVEAIYRTRYWVTVRSTR